MKYLFILLFFSSALSQAQTMMLSAGVEKTVSRTEAQFMMGYQSKKSWRIGSFYQNDLTPPAAEDYQNKSHWYGLFTTLSLAKSDKIVLLAMLRTGLKDEQFVMIVPSLETNVKISKTLSLSIASSYRQGYSAFSVKAQFNLFNPSAL